MADQTSFPWTASSTVSETVETSGTPDGASGVVVKTRVRRCEAPDEAAKVRVAGFQLPKA